MINFLSKLLLLLLLPLPFSYAQLVPIDDIGMSEATGQAFIAIDQRTEGSIDFTKVSLGIDAEMLINADLVEFGEYARSGESLGFDIRLENFALGEVLSDGTIAPFKIKDPFIELAFEKNSDGSGGIQQDLVGIRLGFGKAKGAFTADIKSLSGKLEIALEGSLQPIKDTATGIAWLATRFMSGNTQVKSTAVLVDEVGIPDGIRAHLIGVPKGTAIECAGSGSCGLAGLLQYFTAGEGFSSSCHILGIGVCYELSTYRTLEIGDNIGRDSDGNILRTANGGVASADYSDGLFLSFQSKAIEWTDSDVITHDGGFLNIPEGGIQVNFEQALHGTDRQRTRYIDPYFN